ncbi:MAG: methylated-DNA--[protein]-cysteine S-methyltransferase [Candidatus Omnitrophica bacterium]|nr:methylated-DNA--[protein]-cysteine S-methyltransferase [Candidatus Omnitrophota bacterium]
MKRLQEHTIYHYPFKSPIGWLSLSATQKGLYALDGPKKKVGDFTLETKKLPSGIESLLKKSAVSIRSFLSGKKKDFARFPVDWRGYRTFDKRVLQELRRIPWGRTESYQSLAKKAGKARAARYVGRVLHLNRLPFVIPCHRIVAKNGGLGGFSKGLSLKKRLLKLESAQVDIRRGSNQAL